MNNNWKDLSIMGAIVLVLTVLFAFFYCLGHEYGMRTEHKKTQELVKTVEKEQLTNEQLHQELHIYENYYNSTEDLLDTLEKYDNWVDRFDPYDYYDAKNQVLGND